MDDIEITYLQLLTTLELPFPVEFTNNNNKEVSDLNCGWLEGIPDF